MDKKEFAVWAAALQTYYPRFTLLPNRQAMELWYRELGDESGPLLTAALRRWAATEKWPPSIAELRALCAELREGPLPDWGQGWRELLAAVGRCGLARPEEALASLSPLARETAERLGWREICLSENADTLRAQFRQLYETCSARRSKLRLLPPSLRGPSPLLPDEAPRGEDALPPPPRP